MERSNSSASTSSTGSHNRPHVGAFAYQTRLLERSSSSSGSLSRSGSISTVNSLTTGNGVPSTPTGTRRWTPGHRVGGSLDTVRGKWEERVRAAETNLDEKPLPSTPEAAKDPEIRRPSPTQASPYSSNLGTRSIDHLPSDSFAKPRADLQRTPAYLKRRTMPAPIIASPLSPNNTGVTVESPDTGSSPYTDAISQRIRLPPSFPLSPTPMSSSPRLTDVSTTQPSTSFTRTRRANTLDDVIHHVNEPSIAPETSYKSMRAELKPVSASTTDHPPTTSSVRQRPTSLYGGRFSKPSESYASSSSALSRTTSSSNLRSSSPDKLSSRLADGSLSSPRTNYTSSLRSSSPEKLRSDNISPPDKFSSHPLESHTTYSSTPRSASPEKSLASETYTGSSSGSLRSDPLPTSSRTAPVPAPPSAMSPAPYRSSYLTSKKAATYGENLIVGRKLGRHLPRIASGDADDDWVAEEPKKTEEMSRLERRTAREERFRRTRGDILATPRAKASDAVSPASPTTPTTADDVAGIPGRLRLSRDKAPNSPAAPLPSSRLTRGLWADTQRHLLQAYEYLCHVGEAQQWIEGCLGQELGFGVVEMEDSLRNGVVLAKLVRGFRGEVHKIYEAPKLDFRHSDNINYFFDYVRYVRLPESFIFELTDLYEKKNMPKVIYCIHALSHLLARRGMAERMGNLLGRLQFSDDQLQRTQKGLKDAGVPMPNFGNVGRELAMEINEEPEVEVESEEERRDRLLLEVEPSIIATQSLARAFLVRKAQVTLRTRLQLAQRYIPRLQAVCRGATIRRQVQQQRKRQAHLSPWIIAVQATARGVLLRKRWRLWLRLVRAASSGIVKVQAQIRGYLIRRRFAQLRAAFQVRVLSVVKMQNLARARIVQREQKQLLRVLTAPPVFRSIANLQAAARGALQRAKIAKQLNLLDHQETSVIALQAQARGVIVRRRIRTQLAKLDDVLHVVVRIQAACRTYLARKRLLALIRGLRKVTPILIQVQARARANLARQHHETMNKALSRIEVVKSVGGFQALARAAITRNQHREQNKRLEFSLPDVLGFQSVARGAIVRREWYAWRDHLRDNQHVATILQAMLRGLLQRRKFRAKMEYFHSNLDKVVKIQSLFRAKETRDQYRQLTMGRNVTVGTIKNFVHLLDDSETDFQEEIDLERLRKQVVERIRENQALETDVNELDVKIALVVHNVKTSEELVKARRLYGADTAAAHAARASVLAAHGDPFAGPNTLDHASKRKLELYQQLFYLLQSRGEYLGKLFLEMSSEAVPEKNRRLLERVVLTLFGYGQDRREDYLLLKLFQYSIIEEVSAATSIEDVVHGHPVYINIALHYIRSKQIAHVREALKPLISEVVNSPDLDLEVDPAQIYRARVDAEELHAGRESSKTKNVSFAQALEDPIIRAEYIRHLQVLRFQSERFITAVFESSNKMPYAMRYLARETLAALRKKFPGAAEESYAACIGRLVFYRYFNPAIITPETFDIVSTTVRIESRKNLAQVSKVLAQITSGKEFGDEAPSYIPINEYVRKAIAQSTGWLLNVADAPDAESQYHAHEFLDATVQPKPIYISPNEVYAMHGLLAQHIGRVAPPRDDPLRVILQDLNGVPQFGNEELKDARDNAITLELSNRFAQVKDLHAEEKALWVQAKRAVLAILRVQPGKDLVESLMQPVSEEHEVLWEDILESEMENEHQRLRHPRRMPSAVNQESAYRLEDIRSLSFREVKAHAIYFLLELEKQGKITRDDGYQGILNAIANDVRSKHRMRLQRQQELDSMTDALRHLNERKKYFEEQIKSYSHYVEGAMSTMQGKTKKRRMTMPFSKQFFHIRDLQKTGKTPAFGSFKYSAHDLYNRGILLSIDQFSPRQFDKINIVFSSNQHGVFTIEVFNSALGITNRVAGADVQLEDLLQAQFQDRASLSLFNGLAKFNLNLLLYQLNKKFYV
ncbi:ras GTPase-activating protein [Auriscalpium vulgare]|uniref:Ras GTPase-activating protein n=1 Tax=Auriscalpium vulgare TaxID=40419 RepID=A0ACB8SBT9_9AGAM|nr:ras GTPase-activating protein [Auriscalpium vulgare]